MSLTTLLFPLEASIFLKGIFLDGHLTVLFLNTLADPRAASSASLIPASGFPPNIQPVTGTAKYLWIG